MDDERQLIGISKIARQKVIEQLKHAYTRDYLEETDFERRLEIANSTNDRAILRELVDDLPDAAEDRSPQAASTTFRIGGAEARPEGTIVSVFSGVTRKGEWHPPRHLKIVSAMGGVDLDFTRAVIPPGGVEIDVFCIMGGIDMRVPEGINVDAHPVTFMGGTDTHGFGYYGTDAPAIKVRGLIVMGGLDVKPPRKERFKKFVRRFFNDE
ncbi:MAG: DUF1707 domain-containing protein [Spirochaetales bacterium]|nr:DUF1707 domain-containing protein [Spirochaetales bacterium]